MIFLDNLKIQEEIKALKELGQHLEQQMQLASVELGDFSDDDLGLLDKCAHLYAHLHIHDSNLNYLRDFYFARKKERIENQQIKVQQKIELQKVKDAIDEAAKEVAVLERFKSEAEKRLIPESIFQQKHNQQQATKQGLLERQKAWKTPKEFNMDALIDKVESLERR
ncbi:hypothetical protein KR026_012486 [Drosophila bipectinata]|nr:hypothetical protein KR026_012486 [Drosophila bipectinata]